MRCAQFYDFDISAAQDDHFADISEDDAVSIGGRPLCRHNSRFVEDIDLLHGV